MLDDDIEECGQVEPLTQRLYNILRDYPNGTQIFRELLQNADDAEAKQFVLMLDLRDFSNNITRLITPQMSVLQVPSIICYNDAKFQEDDFASLKSLGRSRKESEPTKTGKFGIGFNSVYHLTDFPLLVSGSKILLLDPHMSVLKDQSREPGIKIDFIKSTAKVNNQWKDSFQPFDNVLGCNIFNAEEFNGTMFRFPLRTDKHAKSEISENLLDANSALALLTAFTKECTANVLYLKHVTTIQVMVYQDGMNEPEMLHTMDISYPTDQDREYRSHVNSILKNAKDIVEKSDYRMAQYTYRMRIKENDFTLQQESIKEWLVSCFIGSGKALELAKEAFQQNKNSRRVPFGAAAATITPCNSYDDSRAYCFLPFQTFDLPVSVNSLFELASSRRELWEPSSDVVGAAATNASWNERLKRDVIGKAYALLLRAARQHITDDDQFYRLFPTFSSGSKWNSVVVSCYKYLFDCGFDILRDMNNRLVSPNKVELASNVELVDKLVSTYKSVVQLPVHVTQGFEQSDVFLRKVNPGSVRDLLRSFAVPYENADEVLEYCCSDRNYEDLIGVQTLRVGESVLPFERYGSTPYYCMPQKEGGVLSHFTDLYTITVTSQSPLLQVIIDQNITNIVNINARHVALLIQDVLKKNDVDVYSYWQESLLNKTFFNEFFMYYATLGAKDRAHFKGLALVPILENGSGTLALIQDNTVLHDAHGFLNHSTLRMAMTTCEVSVLDTSVFEDSSQVVSILHLDSLSVGTFLKHSKPQGLNKEEEQKEVLFNWIVEHFDSSCNDYINKLLSCPIYRVYGQSKYRTAINMLEFYLPPKNIPETLLTSSFIHAKLSEQVDFFKKLKIQNMSDADFFVTVLFKKIQDGTQLVSQEVSTVILSSLKRVDTLQKENAKFLTALKKIRFVALANGAECAELVKVYDPREEDLRQLLDDNYFPNEEYSKYYDSMCKCGMLKELQSEHVDMIIMQIHKNHDVPKATRLLTYLSRVVNNTNFVKWKEAMKESMKKKWIPTIEEKLSVAKNARPYEEANIISTVKAICCVSVSNLVKQLLGWDTVVETRDVVEHLRNIIKLEDRNFRKNIQAIYSFLEKHMTHEVAIELQSFPCILVDSAFVSPKQVQLKKLYYNTEPLLYHLPETFAATYIKLVKALQIPEEFSQSTLISALKIIEQRVTVNNPISEADINLVVAILTIIANGKEPIDPNLVPVLSTENIFSKASELYYADPSADQQHLTEFYTKRAHPKILYDVAKKLGVRSLVAHIAQVAEYKYDGEDFGQKEHLMDRIQDIMKKYPHERSNLLLEMLQNANDAQATEFHIVFDTKQYQTNTLLHPALEAFQGPSLLIYNNAMFKEEDFSHIQHIGKDHKLRKLEKIGRFGLGFNTCYHYTDLPSLVSGERIAFFDPHAKHLPNSSVVQPGRMFRFLMNGFTENMLDQVQPYIHEELGCIMNEEYKGTLFRLPLRTEQQAKQSKISKKSWNHEDVMKMLTNFMAEAPECLIFLQYIQTIRISIKEDDKLKTIFKVDAKRSDAILKVHDDIRNCIHELQSGVCCSLSKQIGTITMEITKGETTSMQEWLLSSVTGGKSAAKIAQQQARSVANTSCRFVPHGSVAILQNGQAIQGKLFTFLPLANPTNLKFHVNGYIEVDESRRTMINQQLKNPQPEILQIQWNKELLRSCVAPAAAAIIEHLAKRILLVSEDQRHKLFRNIMEQLSISTANMSDLVEPMFKRLADKPVFYQESTNLLLTLPEIFITERHWMEHELFKKYVNLPVFVEPALATMLGTYKISYTCYEPALVRTWLSNHLHCREHRAKVLQLNEEDKHECLRFIRAIWNMNYFQISQTEFKWQEYVNLPVTAIDGSIVFLKQKPLYYASTAEIQHLTTLLPKIRSIFIENCYVESIKDNDIEILDIVRFSVVSHLSCLLMEAPTELSHDMARVSAFWHLIELSNITPDDMTVFRYLKLIPTRENVLYSIADARQVYQCDLGFDLKQILAKLGANFVHNTFSSNQVLRKIITVVGENNLAEILKQLQLDNAPFSELTPSEAQKLKSYYQKQYLNIWRTLPLYECTNGERIDLVGKQNKFLYSGLTVPNISGIYVIKSDSATICNDLEIPLLSYVELFRNIFIPQLLSYPNDKRENVLESMRVLDLCSHDKELLAQVKRLAFLNDRTADTLYEEHVLLQTFLPETSFPQGIFSKEEWKPLLRLLEIRCWATMKDDAKTKLLISFAVRVKNSPQNHTEHALLLLKYLAQEQSTTVHAVLSKNNIIPVKKLNKRLYPVNLKPSKDCLESITRCVIKKYKKICFTNKFIVDNTIAHFATLCEKYKMVPHPSAQEVVDHLVSMSKMTPEELENLDKAHDKEFVQTMANEAYDFLGHCWDDNVQVDPNMPLIYIASERKFVSPASCFWQLPKSYPPYQYLVPQDYIKRFQFVFNNFGVTNLPSEECALSVLQETYRYNKGKLDPVLTELCLYLIRHLVTKYNTNMEKSYLLTSSMKLAPQQRTLLFDAPYLENCVQCDRFNFLHSDLCDLSRKLMVKKFSGIVQEKLAVQEVKEIKTKVTEQITRAITSINFHDAILRVLYHENGDEKEDRDLRTNLLQLQDFSVVEVDRIMIGYYNILDNTKISRENSSSQLCSLDASSKKIYLRTSIPKHFDAHVLVAGCINRHLGKAIQDSTLLVQLLKCKPKEMEQVLTYMQVTKNSSSIHLDKRELGTELDEQDRIWFNSIPEARVTLQERSLICYMQNMRGYYGRIVEKIENGYLIDTGRHQARFSIDCIRVHRHEEVQDEPKRTQVYLEDLVCPISKQPFVNPVVANDGHTYEHRDIHEWLRTHNVSPYGIQLENKVLIPNLTLKSLLN